MSQKLMRVVKAASTRGPAFSCSIYSPQWNSFVEEWAPIVHGFLYLALGPYGREPQRTILAMPEAYHAAGANASYEPGTGQIRLCVSVTEGKAGITLEKLTHEMVHASLEGFPDDGGVFYSEGFVDYSVWLLAHAPIWKEHRTAMIEAAAYNIKQRRERAMRDTSDYDRKRWAGGVFAAQCHGPYLIGRLRDRKAENNWTW
jgi:hypothetical protein